MSNVADVRWVIGLDRSIGKLNRLGNSKVSPVFQMLNINGIFSEGGPSLFPKHNYSCPSHSSH